MIIIIIIIMTITIMPAAAAQYTVMPHMDHMPVLRPWRQS